MAKFSDLLFGFSIFLCFWLSQEHYKIDYKFLTDYMINKQSSSPGRFTNEELDKIQSETKIILEVISQRIYTWARDSIEKLKNIVDIIDIIKIVSQPAASSNQDMILRLNNTQLTYLSTNYKLFIDDFKNNFLNHVNSIYLYKLINI